MLSAFLAACTLLAVQGVLAASALPSAPLQETVQMIPVAAGGVQLQTTIYRPPGPGPFPLLLMNHGKERGDPRGQSRMRFLALSREFVQRGYAVAIPMRQGFAGSGGRYFEYDCAMFDNGVAQARDVRAALDYLVGQSWVDASRIVVAGQSYGGMATLAFGMAPYPGVKGLINFAGGLRLHGGECRWQDSLADAFAAFGRRAPMPSLWFYGANDRHFSPALAARLHAAYVGAGGNAELVAFGNFKNDAHGMSGSWDGVKVWWPETEKFLQRIGLPTAPVLALDDGDRLAPTDYAVLDDIDAVPYLKDQGRAAYRDFLGKTLPRAFAVSESGAWSWAEDGDDPVAEAVANCEKNSSTPCRLYAVDDGVVWADAAPATQMAAGAPAQMEMPAPR
ncbi:MAG: CocE/NonD family hydrolase [Burkholderiaceae bacterium]